MNSNRSTLGVCSCENCEDGILVLDESSAPKWKLSCNNKMCSTVVTIPKTVHKVSGIDISSLNQGFPK